MTSKRMRPTFAVDLPLPADEAARRLQVQLGMSQFADTSMSSGRFADLLVDEADRRIWSPQLSIEIEDRDGASVLRGRFAPRPDLWTFIMFVYFFMAFLMLFGAALGYVQWTMDDRPWGLWAVPAGVAIIASLHGASQIGQRLGDEQMRHLRARLDDLVQRSLDSVETTE
jgi:hypothetical protein